MITSSALGIIFANVHDNLISELTEKRSMASIPFGGRYRLVDFSLSNLVNAGISKVGIITRENYQSLMDHLGSGKYWDLDRKNGGIFILPPYSSYRMNIFRGHVDALAGIMTFLERSTEEYVVMCDADVVSNIDIEDMIERHKTSGADVTVACKTGKLPLNEKDIMILGTDKDGWVTNIETAEKSQKDVKFSLDIFVIKRELLIDWITSAARKSSVSLTRDVFIPKVGSMKMLAYNVDTFAEVIDSADSYVTISKKLLDPAVRRELFNADRPVYTKTRDDMPTRYGISAVAENSLIGNGCVIEGTVKNSILFRGVNVEKGAVIENCILMQGTKVGKNSILKNVTADKGVFINDGITLMGTDEKYVFIGKGKEI